MKKNKFDMSTIILVAVTAVTGMITSYISEKKSERQIDGLFSEYIEQKEKTE